MLICIAYHNGLGERMMNRVIGMPGDNEVRTRTSAAVTLFHHHLGTLKRTHIEFTIQVIMKKITTRIKET